MGRRRLLLNHRTTNALVCTGIGAAAIGLGVYLYHLVAAGQLVGSGAAAGAAGIVLAGALLAAVGALVAEQGYFRRSFGRDPEMGEQ